MTPIEKAAIAPAGQLFFQLMHLVHAQSQLLFDEGILIRGAVTIGSVVKSWGQLFGPAVVRAYELERDYARYPRIIIDDRIFGAMKSISQAWLHDEPYDRRAFKTITRRDKNDRRRFVDYLRAVEAELDDPSIYPDYLKRHGNLIKRGFKKYARKPRILEKYEWLQRYHDWTISRLGKRLHGLPPAR